VRGRRDGKRTSSHHLSEGREEKSACERGEGDERDGTHVVEPNVKVVLDVEPFLIREDLAERRRAARDGFVAAEL